MPPDPDSRPSRRGWPLRTYETTTPAGTHYHRLPPTVGRQRIQIIILGGVVFALAVLLGAFVLVVVQLRADRMHENERINQRITNSTCDLLDQLPEGGLLDGPRRKYGCGPGTPISDFPPEVQNQLRAQTPPTPTPARPTYEVAPQVNPGPPSTKGATPRAGGGAEPPPFAPTGPDK